MNRKLEELDLNLLKLLKVVVETRNTSTAADKLGISQTSVSRGVAKLRETFGDQLFIRKAHGVEPSELAEKLAEAAADMLTPFNNVLMEYQAFDPLEYDGDIKICAELSLIEVFGKGLYQAIHDAFPKASIYLTYWQGQSLDAVLDRKTDYLIHFEAYPFPQDIYVHHIHDIEVCLVARKDHPVLTKTTELEDIHDLPLIKITSDSTVGRHDMLDDVYLDNGYKPNIQLNSHCLPIVISALENSDCIKFSSSYTARQSDKLACYPLPSKFHKFRKFSICGGYLQAKRGLPFNQHLHQVVQSFFNSITQPPKY